MMFGGISSKYKTGSTNWQPTQSSLSSPSSELPTPQELSLKSKVNHIARLNLKQHDIDICACQQCIYSRQLNRRLPIRLEMTKDSSYRRQYMPHCKLPPHNLSINYDLIQRDRYNKSSVVDTSNYLSNFTDRKYSKPIRHRPTDELGFKGPIKGLSAYEEQYPSFHNNASPYVKPVEVSVPNFIKMETKSSYQQQFSGEQRQKTESGKNPDHLKGGQIWTGDSSYRQLFTIPQQPELPRNDTSRQRSESLSNSGAYKHQYQTIYRNEYLRDGKKRCGRGSISEINPLLASLQI